MHCLSSFFKKLDHKFDAFPQNQQNQQNYDLKLEIGLKYFTKMYSKYIPSFNFLENFQLE